MLLVGVSGNDPKNDFEIFLSNYAWIICVALVLVIIGVIVLLVIRGKGKGNKKGKVISNADASEWFDALGGSDNVLEVNATGSRLSVKLINKDLMNREALTKLGVSNIVMMSDKITLVTNLDNQKIVENMKNSPQK